MAAVQNVNPSDHISETAVYGKVGGTSASILGSLDNPTIHSIDTEVSSRRDEIREEEEDEFATLESILPEDSGTVPVKVGYEQETVGVNLPPSNLQKVISEVRLLLILAFFAIVGVLARKGITVLTSYKGSFVGGVIWANFSACIIMGMAIQSENAWAAIGPKARVPLYTGITTGFCGTFSSFASMILETFLKSADLEIGTYYHYPNGAYGIMEGAAVIITHMAISISGLHFGKHLIKQYDPILLYYKEIEFIITVCGLLAWIAVTALIAIDSWRSWTFACIVSPIACWTRYYVSKWLNPKVKSFPMGTFAVNVFATLILAILTLINRGKTSSGGTLVTSKLTCHMMQGLEDGYCGTLSTVSTFVVELYVLKSPRSYKYGFSSIVISFIIMLLIVGSYNWTNGLTDPLCS